MFTNRKWLIAHCPPSQFASVAAAILASCTRAATVRARHTLAWGLLCGSLLPRLDTAMLCSEFCRTCAWPGSRPSDRSALHYRALLLGGLPRMLNASPTLDEQVSPCTTPERVLTDPTGVSSANRRCCEAMAAQLRRLEGSLAFDCDGPCSLGDSAGPTGDDRLPHMVACAVADPTQWTLHLQPSIEPVDGDPQSERLSLRPFLPPLSPLPLPSHPAYSTSVPLPSPGTALVLTPRQPDNSVDSRRGDVPAEVQQDARALSDALRKATTNQALQPSEEEVALFCARVSPCSATPFADWLASLPAIDAAAVAGVLLLAEMRLTAAAAARFTGHESLWAHLSDVWTLWMRHCRCRCARPSSRAPEPAALPAWVPTPQWLWQFVLRCVAASGAERFEAQARGAIHLARVVLAGLCSPETVVAEDDAASSRATSGG